MSQVNAKSLAQILFKHFFLNINNISRYETVQVMIYDQYSQEFWKQIKVQDNNMIYVRFNLINLNEVLFLSVHKNIHYIFKYSKNI